MDGKQKRTEKSQNHRRKGIMLGVCILVFLGVLLTGCFALGYKGVGAPGPTVPVKKPAARKAAEPSAAVHFQYNGRDIAAKEVLAAAMEDFKKNHPDEEIKEFELYIVAEENAAYYVVNGIPSDDYKIVL